MKSLKMALIAVPLVLGTAALAEDAVKTEIKIAISDDSNGHAIHFSLDGDDPGFDLHGMQEGETRSIVDESGRSILITREAEGFKFDVDGKTIEMPLFGEKHGAIWAGDGEVGDIDVRVTRNMQFMSADAQEGVTIISGQPIDDVTRTSIQSLLTSSGHSGEVNFVDGNKQHDGLHKVMVFKAEVSE